MTALDNKAEALAKRLEANTPENLDAACAQVLRALLARNRKLTAALAPFAAVADALPAEGGTSAWEWQNAAKSARILPEDFRLAKIALLDHASWPSTAQAAKFLLLSWRAGAFEESGEEAAQVAIEEQGADLDARPVVEAFLTAASWSKP